MVRDVYREERCKRRGQLVEATIRVLAKHGSGRLSVRLIACEAQVSPGLITHHFDTIDNLVTTTTGRIGEESLTLLDQAVELAGADPRARLTAFVATCFSTPVASTDLLAAWLAITGLSQSMPAVAEAQCVTMERLRGRVRQLMTACAPHGDHCLTAKALSAIMEGLWTEMARDPESLALDEARGIVLHWLRSTGMFGESRPAPDREPDPPAGLARKPRRQPAGLPLPPVAALAG